MKRKRKMSLAKLAALYPPLVANLNSNNAALAALRKKREDSKVLPFRLSSGR